MSTAIYGIGGAGKSSLAKHLAKVNDLPLVQLDPQDGGDINNAKAAPSNALIDCAPYQEYALAAVQNADNLIYILKILDPKDIVRNLKIFATQLVSLKQVNPGLKVFVVFDHRKWHDDIKQVAIDSLSLLDFVEFGLPPYLNSQ